MQSFEPVSLSEVESVWGNAHFGEYLDTHKMELVKVSLLKWVCGWACGHTATEILWELKLVTRRGDLTKRGKRQLWEFFGHLIDRKCR